jgi:succinyl-CoA synthetase, beta subunit
MNIHEYQGKELLKSYGVAIQEGIMATNVDQAVEAAHHLQQTTGTKYWVVKAQIHAGGRGKGGGVKLAKNMEEVKSLSQSILGMNLVTPQTGQQGRLVRKILVAQDVYYPGEHDIREFYVSILLNRQSGRNVVVYSPSGGMDIETVADQTPHLIFREEIVPGSGLLSFQCRRIAFNLGLKGKANREMEMFLQALYRAYEGSDAALMEINPVLKCSDDRIVAVDAKITLDDNAWFRHPNLHALRDFDEEDPAEVEASTNNLNFVKLDGNVGCMVNGAGLAMATMDIIKLSGGEPANFLDVGGGANVQTVEAGLKIILSDPNVKAVLINIFGGIVRCDRVANGIVEAYKKIGDIKVPVIVRLQGTNADLGRQIVAESGLKVFAATSLSDASVLVHRHLVR